MAMFGSRGGLRYVGYARHKVIMAELAEKASAKNGDDIRDDPSQDVQLFTDLRRKSEIAQSPEEK